MSENSFESQEVNLQIQPLPGFINEDGSFKLNTPMLSSFNFDGLVPKFDGMIDAGDIKPGYLIQIETGGQYFSVVSVEKDDPEIENTGIIGINYLDELGDTVLKQYGETDQVAVVYENWFDKVLGTQGWGITSGGNAIFTNVGVRGEIEATTLDVGGVSGITYDGNTVTIGASVVINAPVEFGGGGSSSYVTFDYLSGSYVSLGYITASYADLADLKIAGTTIINGGNITTGTINADLITTGFLSGSRINGGVISGQFISGGTIEGSTIRTGATTVNRVQLTGGSNIDRISFPLLRDTSSITLNPVELEPAYIRVIPTAVGDGSWMRFLEIRSASFSSTASWDSPASIVLGTGKGTTLSNASRIQFNASDSNFNLGRVFFNTSDFRLGLSNGSISSQGTFTHQGSLTVTGTINGPNNYTIPQVNVTTVGPGTTVAVNGTLWVVV